MSITLNSFVSWIYRLRALRITGAERNKTRPNPTDDVTRVRDAYTDERSLLRNGQATTPLSAARSQREALRQSVHIL